MEQAESLLRWTASLDLPSSPQDFVSVSTRHGSEYPMNEGHIVSDAGHVLAITEFENHFKEQQAPHSTALHCHLEGKPYLVGPLARLNLNHDCLPKAVQSLSLCDPARSRARAFMIQESPRRFNAISVQVQCQLPAGSSWQGGGMAATDGATLAGTFLEGWDCDSSRQRRTAASPRSKGQRASLCWTPLWIASHRLAYSRGP